jgi:hypothetical protein
MKKIILSLALILTFASAGFSQEVISRSSRSAQDFGNEIKVNFLNLIVLGSIEAGFEKFLSSDHSIDFQVHLNDRFGFNAQSDSKTYKTNSLQASMNFYFGDNENGRFFLFPLAKLRFGDFEEAVDGSIVTTNMNAFIFGAGGGYKWEFSRNFAFGPYMSVARGFSKEVGERFTTIELNGGFSLGYRF